MLYGVGMQVGDMVKVLYGCCRNKIGVIIQDRSKQSFYDWSVRIDDRILCYWSTGLQKIEPQSPNLTSNEDSSMIDQ